ncbi:Protein PHYLLO, chloroplastic [Glycine soja]|nr:Protein PHYLLO, chloroplastic [Glycine soja]
MGKLVSLRQDHQPSSNSSFQLDHANELSNSLKESANINTVWASLIVEECTRLGLMYLCIAPGSRPSPVAVAVASHKLITCISCFDERSLAYHAVGYGRGSHIPAVAITSSGTAVSNLLPAVCFINIACFTWMSLFS